MNIVDIATRLEGTTCSRSVSYRASYPGKSLQEKIIQFCYTRHMRTQKTFAEKVRDIVRKIPKGKTMTYKEVAARPAIRRPLEPSER